MLPEKGTRYYYAGRHYEIIGFTTRDGEPAVYLRDVNTRKRVKVSVIWRLMERHSLPTSIEEAA